MMPMAFSLALLGRVALAEDSKQQAMRCAVASTVVNNDESVSRMRANAETAYYVMQAAQAEAPTQSGRLLVTRLSELAQTLPSIPKPSDVEAAAQIRDCDIRFPVARLQNVALPRDPFARDIMCISVLPLVEDTATYLVESTGDESEPLRWKRIFGIFGHRLTDDVMAKHGYTTADKMKALVGRQLPASLEIGNIYAIAIACEASANG